MPTYRDYLRSLIGKKCNYAHSADMVCLDFSSRTPNEEGTILEVEQDYIAIRVKGKGYSFIARRHLSAVEVREFE
jgi:hypothetical protein